MDVINLSRYCPCTEITQNLTTIDDTPLVMTTI